MRKSPRYIFLRSKSSIPIRKKIKQRKLLLDNEEEPILQKNKNRSKKKIDLQEKIRIQSIFHIKKNKKNNHKNKNKIKIKDDFFSIEKDDIVKNEDIQDIHKSYDAHVVIAHYNEDLNWIKKLKYSHTLISRKNIPPEKIPNKGNEASAYLEYIIKNYHQLKEYTIFVHGHKTSYHHPQPIQKKINHLQFNKPYYNINMLPLKIHHRSYNDHLKIIEEKIVKRIVKESYLLRRSAMFYVHRDLILQNPIEVYKELYQYLMNSNEKSYNTGRYFEYTWHIIFTHQDDDIE